MYVVVVEIEANPGAGEALRKLLTAQAQDSLQCEEGCAQFDVLMDSPDAETFLLYETYASDAAFEAHLAADHTRRFFDAAKPLIRAKRDRFMVAAHASGPRPAGG